MGKGGARIVTVRGKCCGVAGAMLLRFLRNEDLQSRRSSGDGHVRAQQVESHHFIGCVSILLLEVRLRWSGVNATYPVSAWKMFVYLIAVGKGHIRCFERSAAVSLCLVAQLRLTV